MERCTAYSHATPVFTEDDGPSAMRYTYASRGTPIHASGAPVQPEGRKRTPPKLKPIPHVLNTAGWLVPACVGGGAPIPPRLGRRRATGLARAQHKEMRVMWVCEGTELRPCGETGSYAASSWRHRSTQTNYKQTACEKCRIWYAKHQHTATVFAISRGSSVNYIEAPRVASRGRS